MLEIGSEKVTCDSCEIHFPSAGGPDDIPVALLHGIKFQAATWQEPGTLEKITAAGFQAVALDIPGSQKIIIEGAPHPCYLDKPDRWHSELTRFLNSLTD